MNLTAVLVTALLWGASVAGAGWWAYGAGQDHCEAAQARDDRVAQVAYDSAASATASAIAKIEIKNTTITQKMQKEVYEKTVYRDCHSGPDAVRLLNSTISAATPGADTASSVPMPGASAPR